MIRIRGDMPKSDKVKPEYLELLTKREKEILNVIVQNFNKNDYITLENLRTKINKANSSIRNYLKSFTNKQILASTGENKGRKYQINDGIFL